MMFMTYYWSFVYQACKKMGKSNRIFCYFLCRYFTPNRCKSQGHISESHTLMCPIVSHRETSRGSWDVAWENPDLVRRNVTEVKYLCELLNAHILLHCFNIYFVSFFNSFTVSISVPGIYFTLFHQSLNLIKFVSKLVTNSQFLFDHICNPNLNFMQLVKLLQVSRSDYVRYFKWD